MDILNKIKKMLGIKTAEQFAEKIEISFNERKENGEKDPIDNTVEEIMEIIEKHLDPAKTRDMLAKCLESQKLPDRLFEKIATQISKTNNIPDKIITEVIQEADTEVPDQVIDTIIEEGDIDIKERLKLIQNVEDQDIVEKRILSELEILYRLCKDKKDWEITDRINELKEILKDSDISQEIQNLIHQIIARKMAENYYSDISKGTRIYELSKVMPVEEMIEQDLAQMVKQEYQKIEEDRGTKESRFELDELKSLILNQMAKEIAGKYKEIELFVIPQSENMKRLKPNQKEEFIEKIQTFSGKELSRKEILDIYEQINGKVNNAQMKETKLISEIRELQDDYKEESIDCLINILGDIKLDVETTNTISMLSEADFIRQLNSIPQDKRQETIEIIKATLGKRKLATQTIRMEGTSEVDIYVEDDNDQR